MDEADQAGDGINAGYGVSGGVRVQPLPEVLAVVLSESRATHVADTESDIDIYV